MAKKTARPVIIKKEEVVEGGHHGGAWKVAYADFMTAMMAFFLLMWLLNITTDEQKRGIALFFNPMADRASQASNDQSLLETSPLSQPSSVKTLKNGKDEPSETGVEKRQSRREKSQKQADRQSGQKDDKGILTNSGISILPNSTHDLIDPNDNQEARMQIIPIGGSKSGAAESTGQIGSGNADTHVAGNQNYIGSGAGLMTDEAGRLDRMIANMKETLNRNEAMKALSRNIGFKMGGDEIRIEMRNDSDAPMFDSGSTSLNRDGRRMVESIGNWVAGIPEDISIIGDTDNTPYTSRTSGMSNWTLSVMRADATRAFLVRNGYPDRKIRSVEGRSDHGTGKRGITIVIHRMHPLPKDYQVRKQ